MKGYQMSEQIKSPNCPACGAAPLFGFPGQSFCSNDDCNVLTWDPRETAEHNLFAAEYAKIDGEEPPKHD